MKKIFLFVVIIVIAILAYAQNRYDVNMSCMDSVDGNVFFGVTDSTDVKLLKFTLGLGAISISETIDLPDTLVYKQIVMFNEERVGISTETNTYVYYDGYIDYNNPVYYTLYTPIQQMKKSSSDSMYVLFSSGVIGVTSYNFEGGNQFCSQNNTINNISCFDINLEAPLKLVCGGYEVFGNGDIAAQISIFDNLEYYSIPIISYGYGEHSEINKVINDESGIYIIAKNNATPPYGWGSFSLIKINQSIDFSQEVLVYTPTHYFSPMFFIKNGNSVYFAMGTGVARYDLNTTGVGWQSVLSTSYGDIAKNMFIVGNKLVASFEHSSDYGYFVVLDVQSVFIEDNTMVPPDIVMSNYPNPFSGETKISFSLPKTEDVKLEIYNIRGQKIKTLVSETKSSGTYSVIWNGTNDANVLVANGVYFYKMMYGRFLFSKKIILMK